MVNIEPTRIEGLRKFSRDLKTMDGELPKQLRIALNEAAEVPLDYARRRVPTGPTGRARRSLKAKSTRTLVRVSGGGRKAPHYPWLDFGGKVGRNNSVSRPFKRDGRYLYYGYFHNASEMADVLEQAIVRLVRSTGLELD